MIQIEQDDKHQKSERTKTKKISNTISIEQVQRKNDNSSKTQQKAKKNIIV